jgi:hypothetical protein
MILFQLLYAAFCICFAGLNAYLINKGKRIYHGLNACIHIGAAMYAGITYHWLIGIAVLLVARVFFDWFLNIFRKLPLNYVPSKPKSYADKIEKWLFGKDGILPKIAWIVIAAFLNVVYDMWLNIKT